MKSFNEPMGYRFDNSLADEIKAEVQKDFDKEKAEIDARNKII